MYLAWALFAEGPSDRDYLGVLLPKVMENLIQARGLRTVDVAERPAIDLGTATRTIFDVARELCNTRDAFDIAFIHADQGGRGQQRNLAPRSTAFCEAASRVCGFPCTRCIVIAPRKETEAWALADPAAVASALGFTRVAALDLPPDGVAAERLADPKQTLVKAQDTATGRRRSVSALLPAIARDQQLARLRTAPSFAAFETALAAGLKDLRVID